MMFLLGQEETQEIFSLLSTIQQHLLTLVQKITTTISLCQTPFAMLLDQKLTLKTACVGGREAEDLGIGRLIKMATSVMNKEIIKWHRV